MTGAPLIAVSRAASGKPLIPAHQHAHRAVGGRMRLETQVAGSEIELFVKARIVGDMHLAVAPGNGARRRRSRPRCCDTRPAARRSNSDATITILRAAASLPKAVGARSRNRFGELELGDVLGLTEIQRRKQFLQADHLSAARSGVLDTRQRLVQVEPRLLGARHLDQAEGQVIRVRCHLIDAARGPARIILV